MVHMTESLKVNSTPMPRSSFFLSLSRVFSALRFIPGFPFGLQDDNSISPGALASDSGAPSSPLSPKAHIPSHSVLQNRSPFPPAGKGGSDILGEIREKEIKDDTRREKGEEGRLVRQGNPGSFERIYWETVPMLRRQSQRAI